MRITILGKELWTMSERKEKLHTEECKILQSHDNSLYYNTIQHI